MEEQIAQFRFTKYKILKSNIEIKNEQNISEKLKVNFNILQTKDMEENKFRLSLNIHINDENEEMNIDVNSEGYFEFESGLNQEYLKIFFNSSAPAILFPYIRAYITTLTSLSGVKPIILPTLNLTNREKANKD